MTKLGLATIALIGTTLALSGPVWSEGKKSKADLAAGAKVTIDQAIKTASEKVPGKVIEAELETKHDKTVWEVEVLAGDGKIMEVHIDAESGAVIDTEEKKAGHKRERKREHKP